MATRAVLPNPDVVYLNVPMRCQFAKEGKPVDLNCGRYCTEGAVHWVALKKGWNVPGDIFHVLTEEPTPKLLRCKYGWSPANEGSDLCIAIDFPSSADRLRGDLRAFGPLIIPIQLLGPVLGHFILLVGCLGSKVEYKDSLAGNEVKYIEFADLAAKRDSDEKYFAVDAAKLRAKLTAKGY